MHFPKRALIAVTIVSFLNLIATASVAVSQTPATSSASAGMTNDDVVGLAGAGLGDDVIIAKIRKSPTTNFDTSVAGLKALRTAGVSSRVIQVMIDPSAAPAPAATVAAVPVNDPDDPMSPHTGFFLETTGPDGKMHLVKILLTNNSGVKGPSFGSALGSAYSFGIHKVKTKLLIPGTKAEIETPNPSPTFWIYPGGDMSIQNTQLVKLEIKKDHREATGATIGAFSGVSIGGAEGANQALKSERVKDGVYKVRVTQPLTPGSYAFIEGTGGSYRDFDILAP
jgi:hypothetical protein